MRQMIRACAILAGLGKSLSGHELAWVRACLGMSLSGYEFYFRPFQALERRIKEQGYHKIYIETATVLTEACRLYDSAGYQPVGGVETERCDQRRYKLTADVQ